MNKIYSFLSVLFLMLVGVQLQAQTVEFDATKDLSGIQERGKQSITKDGVTISIEDGMLGNKREYRCYKNNTMTISSTAGNITTITFECTAPDKERKGPGNISISTGSYSFEKKIGTWTGEANSVEATATQQFACSKITVVLNNTPSAKPIVPTTEGTIAELVNMKKSKENVNLTLNNAQVVYVDGKTVYLREGENAIMFFNTKLNLPLNAKVSGTVKMNFVLYNGIPEMKDNEETKETQLTITPQTETAQPTVVTIEQLLALQHRCDFVTLKGVTISKEASGKYTNYFANADGQKIQLYKRGTTYDEYVSETTKYNITAVFNNIFKGKAEIQPIDITVADGSVKPQPVAAPTFTPAAGTYTENQTITISVPEGTKVYYTLDGTVPTAESQLYEAPFTIEKTTTVKAIAINAENHSSAVVEALYTINKPLPNNVLMFDFNANKWNLEYGSAEKKDKGTVTAPFVEEGVTLSTESGSTPTRLYLDYKLQKPQLRIYKGGSLTITAPKDNMIQKIEFNAVKLDITAGEQSLNRDNSTWTGEASSVEFVVNGTTSINNIIITFKNKITGVTSVVNNAVAPVIYDLNGRRVQKMNKGIYIVNGKKVMVK